MPTPTLAAVAPRQMARAAQAARLDPQPVLAVVGLDGRTPARFDRWVPCPLPPPPDAHHRPPWTLATDQPTFADAIHSTVECWPVVRDDLNWRIEVDACMVGAVRPSDIGERGLLDFDIASWCIATRLLDGLQPLHVRLSYPKPLAQTMLGSPAVGRLEHASCGWPRAEIAIDRAVTHRALVGHPPGRAPVLGDDRPQSPTEVTSTERAPGRL